MSVPQSLGGQMRVYLGGGEAGVAQHVLNRPEIRPPVQQMGGEAVPERMRRGPGGPGRPAHATCNNTADVPRVKTPPAYADEYRAGVRPVPHQLCPAGHPPPQDLKRTGGNGHHSLLAPLAQHPQGPGPDVRAIDGQIGAFCRSKAGAVEDLHYRAVPEPQDTGGVVALQDLAHLGHRQEARELPLSPG